MTVGTTSTLDGNNNNKQDILDLKAMDKNVYYCKIFEGTEIGGACS